MEKLDDLRMLAENGRIGRREFIGRATALGLSLTTANALFTGTSAFAGTAAAGKAGGTLRIAYSDAGSKDHLEPGLSGDIFTQTVNGMLYDSLVTLGKGWAPQPSLARSWKASADAKTWTFTLRDAQWHDGKPLTAKDVQYTMRRALIKANGNAAQSALAGDVAANGIEVVNKQTVRFHLKKADAFFYLILAARHLAILPAGKPQGVGTGPFMLKSFKAGQSIELTRNPHYWKGQVLLDGVRGVVIPEQSTKVQAVLNGSVDLCDPIDFSSAKSVTQSSNAAIYESKNAVNYRICFDSTVPPLDDPRVRMALKLATDRNAILKVALLGYGTLTSDIPVIPGDPQYPLKLGVRAQDIDRARSLLSEAGHPNGIDVDLYTSPSFAGMVDIAVVYKQVVEPAGIRVNIKQWPADTYWTDVFLVKPAFVDYWIARHPYLYLVLGLTSDATSNESKLKNAAVDQFTAQAARSVSTAKQNAALRSAYQIVADQSGLVVPFWGSSLWAAKKTVKNLQFDRIKGIDISSTTLA